MKKIFLKQGLFVLIFGLFAALLIPIAMCLDLPKFYLFSKDITYTQPNELKKYSMGSDNYYYAEDLVKMDMMFILDYCAGDDSGLYYIVPFGEEEYITVYVENEYLDDFQEMYDGSWKYITGEIDKPYWKEKTIRGVLYPIDEEIMQYTIEWFEYAEWDFGDKEIRDYIVPYTLCYSDVREWLGFESVAPIVLSAFILIACIITAATSELRFWNKVKKQGFEREQVLNDFEAAYQIKNVYIGERYIVFMDGLRMGVVENSRIIWSFLYTTTTTHKTYGIKTGTTVAYAVKVAYNNRKIDVIPCGTNIQDANAVLDYMRAKFPYIVVGHTEELAALYSSDMDGFIRYAQSRRYNDDITRV